jgi:hypothetical protein
VDNAISTSGMTTRHDGTEVQPQRVDAASALLAVTIDGLVLRHVDHRLALHDHPSNRPLLEAARGDVELTPSKSECCSMFFNCPSHRPEDDDGKYL